MPEAITVVATKPVLVDGRSHVQGEVFTVTPVMAAALIFSHEVRFAEADEHPAVVSVLEPDVAPDAAYGLDLSNSTDVTPSPVVKRRRRRSVKT